MLVVYDVANGHIYSVGTMAGLYLQHSYNVYLGIYCTGGCSRRLLEVGGKRHCHKRTNLIMAHMVPSLMPLFTQQKSIRVVEL